MKASVDVQTSTINVPAILDPSTSARCAFSRVTLHGSIRSARSRKAMHHRVVDVVIVAVEVVVELAAVADPLLDAGAIAEAVVEAAATTGGEWKQKVCVRSMRTACRTLASTSMHTSCTRLARTVHEAEVPFATHPDLNSDVLADASHAGCESDAVTDDRRRPASWDPVPITGPSVFHHLSRVPCIRPHRRRVRESRY